MVKNFKGRKEISVIWLAIEADCREHFLNNHQKYAYQYIAFQPIFALIKYFNQHPTASKIILESMEKNKTGDKIEKNFYVNLLELPESADYFEIAGRISDFLEVLTMKN